MSLTSRGLYTHCRQRPVSGATSFSRRDCVASSFDAGYKSRQDIAATSFEHAGSILHLRWPRRDLLQSLAALLTLDCVISGADTLP